MESKARREILKKAKLARLVVAYALEIVAPKYDELNANYGTRDQILSRANLFGHLSFLLVRSARNADARDKAEAVFLAQMGRWMVEAPGQTYMKNFVLPLLEMPLEYEAEDLTKAFDWVFSRVDPPNLKVKRADRFLDLADSPILNYMISLKKTAALDENTPDILPITYLGEMDVKLAHHVFLIDFFFDMLPNLLVNVTESDALFEQIPAQLEKMYADYNVFAHTVAGALLQRFIELPSVALAPGDGKTAALELIIIKLTSQPLDANFKKTFKIKAYLAGGGPSELTTILRSVTAILGVQILSSIVFHLKIVVEKGDSDTFTKEHAIHLINWIMSVFPGYDINDNATLVRNVNLAEHETAIKLLTTLMDALRA